MHRSFGTALFATAVLVCSVFDVASAKPPALTHSLTAGQLVEVAESVEAAPALAPADVQSEDAAPQTASEAADVARWSSPDASALSPTLRHAKLADKARERDANVIRRFARGIVARTSSIALSLTRNAMRFVGTPYVFGGTSPSGFDCSGYVQHVFAMLGVVLPRTADAQFYAAHRAVGGMKTGDLVFFETYLPGPSHVGIYIGSGKFIHSSGHGVMVSHLRDRYWKARYLGAKRVVALR